LGQFYPSHVPREIDFLQIEAVELRQAQKQIHDRTADPTSAYINDFDILPKLVILYNVIEE